MRVSVRTRRVVGELPSAGAGFPVELRPRRVARDRGAVRGRGSGCRGARQRQCRCQWPWPCHSWCQHCQQLDAQLQTGHCLAPAAEEELAHACHRSSRGPDNHELTPDSLARTFKYYRVVAHTLGARGVARRGRIPLPVRGRTYTCSLSRMRSQKKSKIQTPGVELLHGSTIYCKP